MARRPREEAERPRDCLPLKKKRALFTECPLYTAVLTFDSVPLRSPDHRAHVRGARHGLDRLRQRGLSSERGARGGGLRREALACALDGRGARRVRAARRKRLPDRAHALVVVDLRRARGTVSAGACGRAAGAVGAVRPRARRFAPRRGS